MRRLTIILAAAAAAGTASAAGAVGWHVLRPHNPLAQARSLMAHGDAQSARIVLRKMLQGEDAPAEAHLLLGEAHLSLGDPVAAERELRLAIERGSDPHPITPMLAQAVLEQKRYDAVLREFSPEGLKPDDAAELLVVRAASQLGLKQPDNAAITIAEAQRLAPQSARIALAAARVALVRDDKPAAEARLAEALAADPKLVEAMTTRAALRAGQGDLSGALASYDAALAAAEGAAAGAPGAREAIRLDRAALLLAMNDDARAQADVDAVLKANPRSPRGNFLAARLDRRAGKWKAADDALSAVGPDLSGFPRGEWLLAVVKGNLNQPEQAIAAAEQQLARTPADIEVVKTLARLYMIQGQARRASQVLATAASSGHSDSEALRMLAAAYAADGKAGLAAGALEQASTRSPDDPALLTRLAALDLRAGDPSKAADALERALNTESTGPGPASATPAPAAKAVVTADIAGAAGGSAAPPPSNAAPRPDPVDVASTLVITALEAGDVPRALAALERARQAGASPARLAMLDGQIRVAQFDLSGARGEFEEVLRLEPRSARARIGLARVALLQNHADEAMTLLEQVLAADPTDQQALAILVDRRVAMGQADKAVAAMEAAHAAAPRDIDLVAKLANLYTRTGQPTKAMALIDAASPPPATDATGADTAAPPPAPPELLVARATAEMALGQREQSIQILLGMLARNPDNTTLRRRIAELQAAGKDYAAAHALLAAGLARAPDDRGLLSAEVAVTSAESGPDAALSRARELARASGGVQAALLPGDLLMSLGRYSEAASSYQSLLDASSRLAPADRPDTEALTVRLSEAYVAAGNTARATDLLRASLTSHPDSTTAALALSELDLTANRMPDARAHLQNVLVHQPNNPAALNNMALVEQQSGNLEQARTLASRAYLLAPTPQTADTLGWIILAQNHAGEAVPLLRVAGYGLPGDLTVQYHLASALARDGEKDAALAVLHKVLDQPTPTAGSKPAERSDDQAKAEKLLHELSPP